MIMTDIATPLHADDAGPGYCVCEACICFETRQQGRQAPGGNVPGMVVTA